MATRATKLHEMQGTSDKYLSEVLGKCAETMEEGPFRKAVENLSQHLATKSEQHMAESDAATKAAADEILKVSAVAPTIPVRAVLRPGQRGFEKTEVPAEFAKFVTRVADEEN
jgi:hypothetical protein